MIKVRIEVGFMPSSLPETLAGPHPRAHTILSLYDMLRFYAATLIVFCRQLEQMLCLSMHTRNDDELIKKIEDMLIGIKEECERLSLRNRVRQTERVIKLLKADLDGRGTFTLCRELMDGIQDELAGFMFLSLSPTDRDIFLKTQLSKEAQDKFPSIVRDMDEAGKCYALERNSACVFHLMRSLEVTLRSLAKALDVSFERRQWENIINDIEKTIRLLNPNVSDDHRFYSEAAIQFRHFKNAWRNHVIHNPVPYDRAEAVNIFNSVREFVGHLATRLTE